MIPMEIMENTGRVRSFNEEVSEVGLRANLDVIEESGNWPRFRAKQ